MGFYAHQKITSLPKSLSVPATKTAERKHKLSHAMWAKCPYKTYSGSE